MPGDGPLSQVSHDHTHVGWLRRKGDLNERQARTHPARNALDQALGAGHQFVEPQTGAFALRPGDRILLCSDGLVEGLWDRRIEEILRSGPGTAQSLVDESILNSGRDNATAVVVEFPAGAGRAADSAP
jgi:protein phosphatase